MEGQTEQDRAEDAFHRLDAAFVPLSEGVVNSDPSARMHLLRSVAARVWGAPFDALAEIGAAASRAGSTAERSLISAMERFLRDGPVGAAEPLVEHTVQFPKDPLASSLRTSALVLSGVPGNRDRAIDLMLRDQWAEAGDWRFDSLATLPMQELGRYDDARQLAEATLRREPGAAHAAHGLTHVLYETGEHRPGMAWMDDWMSGRALLGYAAHFRWHAALHALALGDTDSALRRYWEGIPPAATVDSASLLWRCRLAGRDVEEAASEVCSAAAPVLDALPVAFAVFNAALGLAAAGDSQALGRLATRMAKDGRPAFADLLEPVVQALRDLVEERPQDAAVRLGRVLDDLPRLGGSNAQREVAEDTYLAALLSAGRPGEAEARLRARLERRDHAWDRTLLAAIGG